MKKYILGVCFELGEFKYMRDFISMLIHTKHLSHTHRMSYYVIKMFNPINTAYFRVSDIFHVACRVMFVCTRTPHANINSDKVFMEIFSQKFTRPEL